MDDLHTELYPMENLPGGETLLLAGDIMVACVLNPNRTDKDSTFLRNRFMKFFKEECAKYNQVFYVAGNHEHYHGHYQNTFDLLRKAVEGTNVTILENETVNLTDDIVLWGGTFWTDFNNKDWFALHAAKTMINDFNLIVRDFTAVEIRARGMHTINGSTRFHPDDAYDLNQLALKELTKVLKANKDKKVVVMTHMAPTFKSSHPRHGKYDNLVNYYYCNQLDNFIFNHPQIKFWVHGHTHNNFDYTIGETRILCNPRGYVTNRGKTTENPEFNPNLIFELE